MAYPHLFNSFSKKSLSSGTNILPSEKGGNVLGKISRFFLKMAFLVQQAIQLNVLVIGSEKDSEGLRYATSKGIYTAIAISLGFFVLSLFFYFLKKEKEDSEL